MLWTLLTGVLGLAALLAVLLLILYIYMKYQHTYWQRHGIPTAPGDHWLFGHFNDAVHLKKSPGLIVTDLYRRAGEDTDLLGIYFLHKPFLLVRSTNIAKHILIKDFTVFPNHYFTARSMTDKVTSMNLFNIEYPDWKYLRTKLTPLFTSGRVKKLFLLMLESADNLKEHLASQFDSGVKTRSLYPVLINTKYTTDVISSLAFGLKTNSFADPFPEFYNKAAEGLNMDFIRTARFFVKFFFPTIGKFLGGEMLGATTSYFREVFWRSMNMREASGTKRGDLIDSLLELKNAEQDTPFKFAGDSLLAQSAIFFVAGRETSIANMTYSLYELALHPEIQKKARAEILENLEKNNGITYEGIQEMTYLFQIMAEAMRLFPAAAILDRNPVSDYKLPGTDIILKKGTPAYIPVQGLHMDEKHFPNPYEFDPDRFSEERKVDIKPCTYMPFGEGPRTCIGMRVGLLQVAVALVTILKDYEVSIYADDQIVVNPRNVYIVPPVEFKLNYTKLSEIQ